MNGDEDKKNDFLLFDLIYSVAEGAIHGGDGKYQNRGEKEKTGRRELVSSVFIS